jgi:hypothetical protein
MGTITRLSHPPGFEAQQMILVVSHTMTRILLNLSLFKLGGQQTLQSGHVHEIWCWFSMNTYPLRNTTVLLHLAPGHMLWSCQVEHQAELAACIRQNKDDRPSRGACAARVSSTDCYKRASGLIEFNDMILPIVSAHPRNPKLCPFLACVSITISFRHPNHLEKRHVSE